MMSHGTVNYTAGAEWSLRERVAACAVECQRQVFADGSWHGRESSQSGPGEFPETGSPEGNMVRKSFCCGREAGR